MGFRGEKPRAWISRIAEEKSLSESQLGLFLIYDSASILFIDWVRMEFYLRRNTSTSKDKVVVSFFPSATVLDLRDKFYFLLWRDGDRIYAHTVLIVDSVFASLMSVARDKRPRKRANIQKRRRVWEFCGIKLPCSCYQQKFKITFQKLPSYILLKRKEREKEK